MRLKEKLADITTPKIVKAFVTPASEEVISDTLHQRGKRLHPIVRAEEWAQLGVVDFAASYLRRSLMRPVKKKEMVYRALVSKFTLLWHEGDVERAVAVAKEMGSLRVRNASLPHIF